LMVLANESQKAGKIESLSLNNKARIETKTSTKRTDKASKTMMLAVPLDICLSSQYLNLSLKL